MGNRVGRRVYNQDGVLVLETPLKDGLKHGQEITWDDDGKLLSIEPYAKGQTHGTAKQYGRNGRVIGTYKMKHGTGFDIWRQEDEKNGVFVSEIHSLKDGMPHGYEWWFASSEQDLMHERHWQMVSYTALSEYGIVKADSAVDTPSSFLRIKQFPNKGMLR